MFVALGITLTILTFAIPIGVFLYFRHSTVKTARKIDPSVSSYVEAKHILNRDVAQNVATDKNKKGDKFCKECGAKIEASSKFCKECGKKQ